MAKCINIKHPDYQRLEASSNVKGIKLEILVGKWQVSNSTDVFPTLNDLGLQEKQPVVAQSDTTIREKILEILNRNGVSVTTMTEYINNYDLRKPEGNVVNALTDTMRQIIAIDENLENAGTLAEEAGHIIVATQVDTPAFNRAMRLVEATEEYQNNYEKYSRAYAAQGLKKGALERKVKMEVLGKLMKTSLFNNLSETTEGTGLRRYLKRMWDSFMKLFRGAKTELEQVLDTWAKNFVAGNVGQVRNEGVFYELGDEVLNQGESLFKRLLEGLRERLKFYENIGRDVTEGNKNYWELYDMGYRKGIFEFLRNASEDIKKTEERIQLFNNGKKFTSNDYRDMKLMLEYYKEVLNGHEMLVDYIAENAPEFSADQVEQLRLTVDDFHQRLKYIDVYHRKAGAKIAQEWAIDQAKSTITDPELLKKEIETIRSTIREVDYDSNKLLHWFGSLVHAKDSFQRSLHFAVTKLRRAVDRFTYELGKALVQKSEQLGIKDTLKFAERTLEGKLTGYFVDRFRVGEFEKSQVEFHQALHEEYGLPEDKHERYLIKRQWRAALERVEDGSKVAEDVEMATKIKEYDTAIAQWYDANTVPREGWQQIIEERKKELGGATDPRFQQWKKENVGIGGKGTKWEYEYPKGELSTPSDGRTKTKKLANGEVIKTKTKDWTNSEYAKLSENEREMLDELIRVKKEADSKLPPHKRPHPLLLPQIKADWVDLIKAKKYSNIFETVKDTFKSAEDDTEFGGSKDVKRPDGTIAQFVPIFFTNRLDNMDNVSTDLVSSVIAYSDMAENYKVMTSSEAAPMFEMALDVIGHRQVNTGKKQYLGIQSEVYKSMEKFIEMNIHGKWKEKLEWKGWNISKIMKNLIKFVTANNLAFSLYTTLASYLTSSVYSKIEDLVGQYTNQSNKIFAEKTWDTNIHQVLVESGKKNKTNKLGLFFEKHHILKSNRSLFDNLDKSRLTRKALDSGLYWSYELVKLRVRGKLALAIADNYKYYNGKFHSVKDLERLGVENIKDLKNYWDMVEVKDGRLIALHNDPEIEDIIERKVEYIGNNIDGELSYSDWAAAHQGALAQLVTTHRGWLFRNIQLRFKPKGVNYQTGQEEAGFYMNFFDFMHKTFLSTERVTSIKGALAQWEQLTPAEKHGVLRTIWEIAFLHAIAAFALIVNNLAADDDEDDSLVQYLAYMSNRVLLEVGALNPMPVVVVDPVAGDFAWRPPLLANVQELIAILNSPVAAARQVDDLMDITSVFSSEEIEQGPFKGMTKRERLLIKMTPGLKALYQVRDPKSRNQYLLNKTLTWLIDK